MTAYEQIEALVDACCQEHFSAGIARDLPDMNWPSIEAKRMDARTALLAAVKALAEDAERYRWLRDRYILWSENTASVSPYRKGAQLDSAIDAARSAASARGESK